MKGIAHRLSAFELFLQTQPDWRGKVTYLQIAPKSRTEIPEYADMEQEVGSAAGRINGAYGEADWTPIRDVNRAYSHSTLAGLYRAACVGLVTPLRDGMNLVAKEYVASQNPDDPGVLILSRFAGAAYECTAALLVNPYDPDSVASAIGQALSMLVAERRERHDALFRVLSHNDIQHWADQFLTAPERKPRALSRLEQMPSVAPDRRPYACASTTCSAFQLNNRRIRTVSVLVNDTFLAPNLHTILSAKLAAMHQRVRTFALAILRGESADQPRCITSVGALTWGRSSTTVPRKLERRNVVASLYITACQPRRLQWVMLMNPSFSNAPISNLLEATRSTELRLTRNHAVLSFRVGAPPMASLKTLSVMRHRHLCPCLSTMPKAIPSNSISNPSFKRDKGISCSSGSAVTIAEVVAIENAWWG